MEEKYLKLLRYEVAAALDKRFAKLNFDHWEDAITHCLNLMGTTLGETLDEVEFPTQWRRLLRRKDCPAYMKALTKLSVNVYYPKVSLPKEQFVINLDKASSCE